MRPPASPRAPRSAARSGTFLSAPATPKKGEDWEGSRSAQASRRLPAGDDPKRQRRAGCGTTLPSSGTLTLRKKTANGVGGVTNPVAQSDAVATDDGQPAAVDVIQLADSRTEVSAVDANCSNGDLTPLRGASAPR